MSALFFDAVQKVEGRERKREREEERGGRGRRRERGRGVCTDRISAAAGRVKEHFRFTHGHKCYAARHIQEKTPIPALNDPRARSVHTVQDTHPPGSRGGATCHFTSGNFLSVVLKNPKQSYSHLKV